MQPLLQAYADIFKEPIQLPPAGKSITAFLLKKVLSRLMCGLTGMPISKKLKLKNKFLT
jgi:hypothetical protein